MPLTQKGEEKLRSFKKRYGGRGEEVFYRWLNKKSRGERKIYEKE